MTREAQRIAIAEACGIRCAVNPHSGNVLRLVPVPVSESGTGFGPPVPDYPNDLNAMHAAEKVLTGPQRERYLCELQSIVSRYGCHWALLHATAAQRAEAFLRTLNLWHE